MAQKRSAEYSEDCDSVKILKQLEENDGDMTLDSSDLSPDFRSSLEYDCVMKTFSVTLEKDRKEGNRFICFGEEEMRKIIKLLPVIEKLVSRYSIKKSPTIIDIPFEACDGKVGDLVTVISLKENSYKRGHFDVDLRKCIKKEDGSYQYTSEGVRVTLSLISDLKASLFKYQSLITAATEKSTEVILMAIAHAVIHEINMLADPRQNCHGCQIQHPSQKHHMGPGGCMTAEQPPWDEICNEYWQAGKTLINDDVVQNIAQRAASRIPELQVLSIVFFFFFVIIVIFFLLIVVLLILLYYCCC